MPIFCLLNMRKNRQIIIALPPQNASSLTTVVIVIDFSITFTVFIIVDLI